MQSQPTILVILTTGRSFSTLLAATLGGHPSILALPETCLLARESMQEFLADSGYGPFSTGLIGAVAELHYPDDPRSIEKAQKWIHDRRKASTKNVLEELISVQETNSLELIIEKTPITTSKMSHMERCERWWGDRVRYLHLVRHPHTYGQSMIETASVMLASVTSEVAGSWFSSEESIFSGLRVDNSSVLDPEGPWLRRNRLIDEFLRTIPEKRWSRLRGEELIENPKNTVETLSYWLNIPLTEETLALMLQTQNWRFAKLQPQVRGGDRKFYRDPRFRQSKRIHRDLAGPIPWATDGRSLSTEAQQLARQYGY